MKIKFFTLIFSCILVSQYVFAQKYRTLEQFQEHFIDNYQNIDKIEGIWYVYLTIYADNITPHQNEFMVAIIKEKDEYYQYTIEEGYYKPNPGYKKFTKDYSSYKCVEYEDQCRITMSSTSFYLSNNKFTYNLDATRSLNCYANKNLANSVIKKYSYSKIYPLESDIEKIKKPEKIEKSTGTGFAISSDGYIVTNYHVVENATKIKVKGIKGDFSKSYSAKVMVSDKNNDLAILKIEDYSFTTLGTIPYTIKNTSANVGENIFVLGYPLTATMGEEIKLTNGIISSKSGFQGDITSYQMTAPIQPGNSGAPMFDKDGNLVGIVNAKHVGAENAGYAVKTSYLFNLIDALPTTLKLPTVNTLKGKTLSSQVELANKFVYIIEVE